MRLVDHPALSTAAEESTYLIPLFILDDSDPYPQGPASLCWLRSSLSSFEFSLRRLGSQLIIRRGDPLEILTQLITETDPTLITWHWGITPHERSLDGKLQAHAQTLNIETKIFAAATLGPLEQWTNLQGSPYQVFTPFWKTHLSKATLRAPLTKPTSLPPCPSLSSLSIDSIELFPDQSWAKKLISHWIPGEDSALKILDQFAQRSLAEYAEKRDFPHAASTSLLSPHLHFGEISPISIWNKLISLPGSYPYLRQLAWREFAHSLLISFPHTPTSPLRPEYTTFPWNEDTSLLKLWQRGLTGYPFIDAAMRQLWQTGWMHNRCRMVVASFLVKDLRICWLRGAEWFLQTLVDADLANNTLGWQWAAGCGADAAPYFRIFHPLLQSQKFDTQGNYIRRFVPELKNLPAPYIHSPWQTPKEILDRGKVELGSTYPYPIVDHQTAARETLTLYHSWRKSQTNELTSA